MRKLLNSINRRLTGCGRASVYAMRFLSSCLSPAVSVPQEHLMWGSDLNLFSWRPREHMNKCLPWDLITEQIEPSEYSTVKQTDLYHHRQRGRRLKADIGESWYRPLCVSNNNFSSMVSCCHTLMGSSFVFAFSQLEVTKWREALHNLLISFNWMNHPIYMQAVPGCKHVYFGLFIKVGHWNICDNWHGTSLKKVFEELTVLGLHVGWLLGFTIKFLTSN